MREPFYCGTQRMDWMYRNCDRCTKFDPDTTPEDAPCDIDAALTRAAMGEEVPDEIKKRMGVPDDVCAYTWDCPERVLEVSHA